MLAVGPIPEGTTKPLERSYEELLGGWGEIRRSLATGGKRFWVANHCVGFGIRADGCPASER